MDLSLIHIFVVVGYGSQKKETLTGAVTVVSDKMLTNKGSMSSPVQALQGQVDVYKRQIQDSGRI